jgi:hypothetical protein
MLKSLLLIVALALSAGAHSQPTLHQSSHAAQLLPETRVGGYFDSEQGKFHGIGELGNMTLSGFGPPPYLFHCGEPFTCGLLEFSPIPASQTAARLADAPGIDRRPEQTVFNIVPVPEPATYAMLILGAATLVLRLRTR